MQVYRRYVRKQSHCISKIKLAVHTITREQTANIYLLQDPWFFYKLINSSIKISLYTIWVLSTLSPLSFLVRKKTLGALLISYASKKCQRFTRQKKVEKALMQQIDASVNLPRWLPIQPLNRWKIISSRWDWASNDAGNSRLRLGNPYSIACKNRICNYIPNAYMCPILHAANANWKHSISQSKQRKGDRPVFRGIFYYCL